MEWCNEASEVAEADADTWPGCGVPVGCGPEPTLRLLDEPCACACCNNDGGTAPTGGVGRLGGKLLVSIIVLPALR